MVRFFLFCSCTTQWDQRNNLTRSRDAYIFLYDLLWIEFSACKYTHTHTDFFNGISYIISTLLSYSIVPLCTIPSSIYVKRIDPFIVVLFETYHDTHTQHTTCNLYPPSYLVRSVRLGVRMCLCECNFFSLIFLYSSHRLSPPILTCNQTKYLHSSTPEIKKLIIVFIYHDCVCVCVHLSFSISLRIEMWWSINFRIYIVACTIPISLHHIKNKICPYHDCNLSFFISLHYTHTWYWCIHAIPLCVCCIEYLIFFALI